MFAPNGFLPSTVVHARMYDEEGRLKAVRPGPGPHTDGDGGIAEANSLYATDAEFFGEIAPFLKRNRLADAQRRNYIIQPGGACIYFKEDPQLADPYDHNRVQYTDMPSERESFGHNSMDGTKLGEPNGRAFTVGAPGALPRGSGR